MFGYLFIELGMIFFEEKFCVNMCDFIQILRVYIEFVDYIDGVVCMQVFCMCIYVDLIILSFLSNIFGFFMCIYVDLIIEYY